MKASADALHLDSCGCCAADVSKVELFNRPGLPAVAYRIGTHPTFLQGMLARLSAEEIPGAPPDRNRPLAALTTRAGDDPSIALLDAWATMADVLTFYQERIANEGYLRTATERRSLLDLARTIGYELNPGVAAGTFLAFTVETAPGAPGVAIVSQGTKVQSIPGQGQLPQTFETVEAIQARAEWNTLRPQLTESQAIVLDSTELYLKGVTTQLQPGDALLLVGDERDHDDDASERWDFRILQSVTPQVNREDPAKSYTLVTWKQGLGDRAHGTLPAAANLQVFAFRQRASLFGHNAPDWRAMPDSVKMAYNPDYQPQGTAPTNDPGIEWPGFEIRSVADGVIDLDAAYPKILAGSWVVLVKPGWAELYKAQSVSISARTDFTLTAKTTRIRLDTNQHLNFFGLRSTVVFAQSEPLELAEKPVAEPVHGDEIVLDQLVGGLAPGQTLIVSGKRLRVMLAAGATGLVLVSAADEQRVMLQPGESLQVMAPPALISGSQRVVLSPSRLLQILTSTTPQTLQWQLMDRDGFLGSVTTASNHVMLQPADEDDVTIHEVGVIKTGTPAGERIRIILSTPLQNSYDRTTVVINANVARATHGETVRDEVLGSGDGAQPHQRFGLKKPPLTCVSAPTPSGARSTLEVRVNGVLWAETLSLFGLEADSPRYIVRLEADGKTQVIFGDSHQGARLPTGQENVVATYRSGIGFAGNVPADKLTLLQTRPLGVRGVTNPLPASGAAEPEGIEDARTNAPLTVLTLDRIVSLRDFENFARSFAGIGKAKAVALWTGAIRLVHLTIAAANGDEVADSSELYVNLIQAIDAQRDPVQRVAVGSYRLRTFSLQAGVLADPRYVPEEVRAQVKNALLSAFTFQTRDFGQPVTAAEVVKVMQAVQGVIAVDLDTLTLNAAPAVGQQPPAILPAQTARVEGKTIQPAELLLLDPQGVDLQEMLP